MSFLNGARWINGLFAGALNWTPTANRTIALPDASGTLQLDNLSKVRYLFVIAGESNSGGTAPNSTLTAIDLVAQPHAKIWNNTSSVFQPLQIGTNNLIGHAEIADNTTHSIERGLAREILNTLQWPEAYILKAGQGGSTIAQWSVGNASGYLSTLTSRYNAAVSALTTAGFIVRPVFIWLQGINDAIAGTAPATWRTATQSHFTQIRSLMGANTPIFMPLLMTNTAAKIALNTEINTIDAADANMWALPTSGITALQGDGNHYTANGYLQIARAFIDSFRSNLGVPGTFSIGQARTASSNPEVSVKRNTAQTIAANGPFAILLNSVEIDTDNMFNATTSQVVITPGAEGAYLCTGMAATDLCQQIRVQIYVNAILRAQSPLSQPTTDSVNSGEVTRKLRLAVGDVVTLNLFHVNTTNSSRTLFIQPEFQACLQMTRTGP